MTGPAGHRFVAVDWGTSRLRAALVDPGGAVLARTQSDSGVQGLVPEAFPAVFRSACGAWLDAEPGLPVLMAGMVGSRNGWIEAPYFRCPCGPGDLARGLTPVPGIEAGAWIVPGVDARWEDGSYDVMRGEETQVFGAGLEDGLVCLPGTHSKWVEVAGGRIVRFASFITGELYAALASSFVGRLAEDPEDRDEGTGFAVGTAALAGGLTRALFQARTRVLAGDMNPRGVRPFLSALLIEAEIAGAIGLFGADRSRPLRLVAGAPQRAGYGDALRHHGFEVQEVDPAMATLSGLQRILAARS